jgi:hypothetical protein
MILAALHEPAYAAWHSEAGNLPGLESGGKIAKELGLTVGAGAAAAIIYFKVIRRHNAPVLVSNASEVQFGGIPLSAPKTHEIAVTNKSKNLSTIQVIEVNGESFALATKPSMPVIVKPGESFRFSVVFDPGSDRSFKGKVRVRSLVSGKDGARTLDIGLAGRGVPTPAVNLPASQKVSAAAR